MEPFQELAKCATDFYYFLTTYVKINNPIKGLLNWELHDYQRELIAHYEKNKHNILVKHRSGGLSTITVLYAFWQAAFKCEQNIVILSNTKAEAKQLSQLIDDVMLYLPEFIKPNLSKNTISQKIFPMTGSSLSFWIPEAACGKKIDLLIIDEAAFIKNMDRWWTCLFPMIYEGKSIILSTPNGTENWFYQMYQGAICGENSINAIKIDYRDNPLFKNKEYLELVKENLGEEGFAQEVEGIFLSVKDAKTMTNQELATHVVMVDKKNKFLQEASKRLSSLG
jgi:hypothetical protein